MNVQFNPEIFADGFRFDSNKGVLPRTWSKAAGRLFLILVSLLPFVLLAVRAVAAAGSGGGGGGETIHLLT